MLNLDEVPSDLPVYARKKYTLPKNALAPTDINGAIGWVFTNKRRYRCQRNVAKGKWFYTPERPGMRVRPEPKNVVQAIFAEEKHHRIDPVMGTPERADMAGS
jgi:hypothetical protein